MENEIDKTVLRVAVLTIVIVVFFNVLQYIPEDKTYESLNFEMGLKLFASLFFNVILVIFVLYLLVLLLNLGYRTNVVFPKLFKFVFDLGITFTILMAFIEVSFFVLLLLLIHVPFLEPGWFSNLYILVITLLSSLFFSYNLNYYFPKFFNLLKFRK